MPYLLTSNPPGSPTSWVKMETDSVLSGNSEFSTKQQQHEQTIHHQRPKALSPLNINTGKYSNYVNTTVASASALLANGTMTGAQYLGYSPTALYPSRSAMPLNGILSTGTPHNGVSNYSLHRGNVNINYPNDLRANSVLSHGNYGNLESPYGIVGQQSGNIHGTLVTTRGHSQQALFGPTTGGQTQASQGVDVQIIPQDLDWGDNTTAVTGFSDLAFSPEKWPKVEPSFNAKDYIDEDGWMFAFHRYIGAWTIAVVSMVAFFSPILMLVLPHLDVMFFRDSQLRCDVDCDGELITFSAKLILLLIGTWAVFFRQPKATMPRIFMYRALLSVVVASLTFTFWLFFWARLGPASSQRKSVRYLDVVHFAASFLDALIFIHYLAVMIIEIRHLNAVYYIKVVRSPDGVSRMFPIGSLSIQRAASWVLEKYYSEFPIYNPYLAKVPNAARPTQATTNFKHYEIDTGNHGEKDPLNLSHGPSKGQSLSDRYFEECDYDRRVKKRKFKLTVAAEEAFKHVKRINDRHSKTPSSPLDPYEAAQAIFPGIARALQKYLRITRQQPRHSIESILNHLADTIKHGMGHKAFLEKFIIESPVIQNDREQRPVQSWSLICDHLLSRSIRPGVTFQLRQGDVALLCHVIAMPHFNITEQVIDQATNKFLIRNTPETPV